MSATVDMYPDGVVVEGGVCYLLIEKSHKMVGFKRKKCEYVSLSKEKCKVILN